MTMFSRFLNDESGATAIEYGLIAAIISVGIITVLGNVKGSLQSTFSTISTKLDDANTAQ
jgi:pilus assembly protein Flp/PilA